jgi:hypothetical protein
MGCAATGLPFATQAKFFIRSYGNGMRGAFRAHQRSCARTPRDQQPRQARARQRLPSEQRLGDPRPAAMVTWALRAQTGIAMPRHGQGRWDQATGWRAWDGAARLCAHLRHARLRVDLHRRSLEHALPPRPRGAYGGRGALAQRRRRERVRALALLEHLAAAVKPVTKEGFLGDDLHGVVR